MYTARSFVHRNLDGNITNEFDEILITNLRVKQALIEKHSLNLENPLDLGSFARGFPIHFFAHSNLEQKKAIYRSIINDPSFSSVISSSSNSALEKGLNSLIYKHMEMAPSNAKDEL